MDNSVEICINILENYWSQAVGQYGENDLTNDLYNLIQELKEKYT